MLPAIIVLAVALALLALVVAGQIGRRAPGPPLVGRSVVVHTRLPDDQTIRGVLHGQYADRWTLRDAIHVTAVGDQALGGLQHIPVTSISWVQEIEPKLERPQ